MEKLKLNIQLFATQLGSRGNYYVRSGTTTPSESIDNGGDYSGYYRVYYTHLTNGHTQIQVDTIMRRHTSAPPTSSTNEGTCRWGNTSVSNTINGQTKTHTISAGYYIGSARTTYYSGVYFSDTFDVDMTNGRPYTLSGSLVFGGYRIDPSYIGTVPANPYGQSRINSADNLTVDYGDDTSESSVLFTQYISDATHKLTLKYGSTILKEIEPYNSGEVFQLTNTELQTLYNLTQNLPSPYTISLELLTYQNGSQIGSASSFNIQLEVNDLSPELSNITYSNDKSTLSGDNPIKGISNITIGADITTKGSATIVSASVNGVSASVQNNHLSCSLEKVETNSFVISIVDSRGYSVSQTITKGTLIPYLKLSYDGNSHRLNPTSGIIVIDLRTATFWSGNFKPESDSEPNTLTIKYKLWQAGTSEPSSWTTIANAITTSSGSTTITPAENTYSMQQQTADLYGYKNAYKLKVLLQDKINSYEIERNITRGQPVYHWDDKDFYIGNDGDDAELYINNIGISFEIVDQW